MENIKFNYLYRDAGNYKTHDFIIFTNPEKLKLDFIESELRKRLIDSEFFDPTKLRISKIRHLGSAYDEQLDHSWNEFSSIEMTNEAATDKRSIEEFMLTLKANSISEI